MTNFDDLVASLPDPERDPLPPRVEFTPRGALQAEKDRMFKMALLNTKTHTEQAAKYILEGRLFGGSFQKDGDWVTYPNGRSVYQKKVSDFVGGIPMLTRPNAHCYVEVKGVSPGQSFAFSRLDKRNNPRQPSQYEKLSAEVGKGNVVWLFIGWWDSDVAPMMVKQGSREVRRWYKKDVEMTGTLIRWVDWVELTRNHKRRSLRQKDRHLLDDCRIYKVGGRWMLADNHWWIACL